MQVNPANPLNLFMAANHYDGSRTTVMGVRSFNGGQSWTTITTDFMGNSYCDPSVAFDRFGNLFVSYLRWDGISTGSHAIVILLSTDGGTTFSTLRTITDSDNSFDQPRISTGPGGSTAPSSLWVTAWDSRYMKATGTAVTGPGAVSAQWTPLTQLPDSRDYDFGSVAIGPAGQVAIAFGQNTPGSLWGPTITKISVNPDGLSQSSFETSVVMNNQMGWAQRMPARPFKGAGVQPWLAWDRSGGPYHGRLYMAYADYQADFNNTDIFVIYSDNAGTSWSAPVKVNTDATAMSQFFHRIALDQTSGKVALSWYDCRADTHNIATQFYAAVSSDGGLTFSSPNAQLESGESSVGIVTDSWNQNYLDYTGLAYYGGYFYPAWADNSNDPTAGSNPDFPNGLKEMDIYVAKVQY